MTKHRGKFVNTKIANLCLWTLSATRSHVHFPCCRPKSGVKQRRPILLLFTPVTNIFFFLLLLSTLHSVYTSNSSLFSRLKSAFVFEEESSNHFDLPHFSWYRQSSLTVYLLFYMFVKLWKIVIHIRIFELQMSPSIAFFESLLEEFNSIYVC